MHLLCFLAEYWEKGILTSLQKISLFKFVDDNNRVDWASLLDISNSHKHFNSKEEHISWLGKWSGEFGCVANFKFMPSDNKMAMIKLDSQILSMLRGWLNGYPQIT